MCRIEYGLSMTKRFGLAKKGHIISIAVLEEYRSKGIGTKLIKEALEEIRKDSGKECYLEVRITNTGRHRALREARVQGEQHAPRVLQGRRVRLHDGHVALIAPWAASRTSPRPSSGSGRRPGKNEKVRILSEYLRGPRRRRRREGRQVRDGQGLAEGERGRDADRILDDNRTSSRR